MKTPLINFSPGAALSINWIPRYSILVFAGFCETRGTYRDTMSLFWISINVREIFKFQRIFDHLKIKIVIDICERYIVDFYVQIEIAIRLNIEIT